MVNSPGADLQIDDADCERSVSLWHETSFSDIFEELRSGRHRHVVMLMGSAISMGRPSNCLSVGDIRSELVLRPARRDDDPRGEVSRIVDNLLRTGKHDATPEASALKELPFEHFMGCLHLVDAVVGVGVIELACGRGFQRSANANHHAVADVATWLLNAHKADRVTVLTTNYDMWLDDALHRAAGVDLTRVPGLSIPRFEVRCSGGVLRYAKLHGTLEDPDGLVFTFEQMARLVVDAPELSALGTWIREGSPPSLLVAAGYGFWDPDLRPLFETILSEAAVVIRNERPQKSRQCGDFDLVAPSGPTVLQTEFFAKLARKKTLLEYRSHLHGTLGPSDATSLLTGLRNVLVRPDGDDTPPPAPGDLAELRQHARELFASRMAGRVPVFLGRLLDAACIPAKTDLFRLSANTSNMSDRCSLVRAHLDTLSNAHRMDDLKRDCRSIRESMSEPAIAAIALARESFALSIGGKQSLLRAARCLRQCASLLEKCDADTVAFVDHYDCHFKVKVLEMILLRAGDVGHVLGFHRFAARRARRMTERLQNAINQARHAKDLRLMSDAMTLLVECSILAGQLDRVEEIAESAREVRLFMGRLNNAALSDRMMGWVGLAKGDELSRSDAIGHFARGLWKSLSSNDPSIRGKLAANLIRALHGRGASQLDKSANVQGGDGELAKACGVLADGGFAWRLDEPVMEPNKQLASRVVVNELVRLYGRGWFKLRAQMSRHANLKRYPIFLPAAPSAPDG